MSGDDRGGIDSNHHIERSTGTVIGRIRSNRISNGLLHIGNVGECLRYSSHTSSLRTASIDGIGIRNRRGGPSIGGTIGNNSIGRINRDNIKCATRTNGLVDGGNFGFRIDDNDIVGRWSWTSGA